jgi:hypothetical protein
MLLHLPPLAAGLILMTFNIQGHFIGKISSTTLSTLQFAAKMLEVLMQLSLGTMLLSLVRNATIDGGNLPLGFFIAPARINDLSYLWSLELWGSLTSRFRGNWRTVLLAVAAPAGVVLAAIVGPSGAVLMIPRPVEDYEDKFLMLMDNQSSLYRNNVHFL